MVKSCRHRSRRSINAIAASKNPEERDQKNSDANHPETRYGRNSNPSPGISTNNVTEKTSDQEIPNKGKRKSNQEKHPGTTIIGHGYELRSKSKKVNAGLEKDAVDHRPIPPASSSKTDEKIVLFGVTLPISAHPSRIGDNPEKGKGNPAQRHSSAIIDEGKAKVGVTKGVSISEPNTRINPEFQEQEKGKKVESSYVRIHQPIQTPSESRQYDSRVESESSQPIFHITWDGDVEESESVPDEVCAICEKRLSSRTNGSQFQHDDEYDYYFEPINLPGVSVLGCGHVYHPQCLEFITSDHQQRTDPPCFVCLSALKF